MAVVSCVRKTHIGFFLKNVLTLFTNSRLLRRFCRCPGRLLCWERVAAPPGRHCPGRVLLRLPLHRRAAGRSCCVSIIAGPGVTPETGKTHDICICSFSYLRSIPQVVRGAAAPGCCGVVLRRRAGDPRGVHKGLKTHARNSLLHICLASFCHEGRYFSPLHEGLTLCFVRHVSAHHSMLPLVYRLMGNSTFGGSMFIVAACSMCFPPGLLLSCSCSTSLDSAFFAAESNSSYH